MRRIGVLAAVTVLCGCGGDAGRVDTPTGLELRLVSPTEAWGVERNEIDAPFVVRCAVVGHE